MGRDARMLAIGFVCGALAFAIGSMLMGGGEHGALDTGPVRSATEGPPGPFGDRRASGAGSADGSDDASGSDGRMGGIRASDVGTGSGLGSGIEAGVVGATPRATGEDEAPDRSRYLLVDKEVLPPEPGARSLSTGGAPPATLVCRYRNADGTDYEDRQRYDSDLWPPPRCPLERIVDG